MTTLLQINAGPPSGDTHSNALAGRLVEQLRRRHHGSRLIVRDLDRSPIRPLHAVNEHDDLVEELRSADVVVLALPSHPSAGPSPLKAWFEQLIRAGVSFEAASSGPAALIDDRRFYVVAASGGFHKGTVRDTQTLYVRDFLNFLGIHDVEFVSAETALDRATLRNKVLAGAGAELEALAA